MERFDTSKSSMYFIGSEQVTSGMPRLVDEVMGGSKPMSEEAQRLSGAMGRYEEMDEVHYEALAVRTKERDAAQAEARVWKFLAFVLAVCVVLAVAVAAVHGGR